MQQVKSCDLLPCTAMGAQLGQARIERQFLLYQSAHMTLSALIVAVVGDIAAYVTVVQFLGCVQCPVASLR